MHVLCEGFCWTFSFVEIGINHPSGGILAIKLPCITDQGTIVQGCFQVERSARLLRGVVWTFPFVEIGINHLSGAILAMEFPCIMEQGKIVQELFPTVGNISARTMRGVLWTFSFVEIGINHPSGGILAMEFPYHRSQDDHTRSFFRAGTYCEGLCGCYRCLQLV